MTLEHARAMRTQIVRSLAKKVRDRSYDEIYVDLGSSYLPAVDGLQSYVEGHQRIYYGHGRIGERLRSLREWLLEA